MPNEKCYEEREEEIVRDKGELATGILSAKD